MKIKNYLNRDNFVKNYKVFTMPSETIPDQTMSMRELLDRHARGLPVDAKVPIWDENPDLDDILPDVRTMDLSEKMQFIETAKTELEEIKKKANTKAKNIKKNAEETTANAGGENA
jgi:hypothetical protein